MEEKWKLLKEGEEMTLGYREAKELLRLAHWGECYRDSLRGAIKRYSRILQPTLSGEILDAMTEHLEAEELRQLESCYSKMAQAHFPPERQLESQREAGDADNLEFRI